MALCVCGLRERPIDEYGNRLPLCEICQRRFELGEATYLLKAAEEVVHDDPCPMCAGHGWTTLRVRRGRTGGYLEASNQCGACEATGRRTPVET